MDKNRKKKIAIAAVAGVTIVGGIAIGYKLGRKVEFKNIVRYSVKVEEADKDLINVLLKIGLIPENADRLLFMYHVS